jgi:hypothetical protein
MQTSRRKWISIICFIFWAVTGLWRDKQLDLPRIFNFQNSLLNFTNGRHDWAVLRCVPSVPTFRFSVSIVLQIYSSAVLYLSVYRCKVEWFCSFASFNTSNASEHSLFKFRTNSHLKFGKNTTSANRFPTGQYLQKSEPHGVTRTRRRYWEMSKLHRSLAEWWQIQRPLLNLQTGIKKRTDHSPKTLPYKFSCTVTSCTLDGWGSAPRRDFQNGLAAHTWRVLRGKTKDVLIWSL